jgi:alpha-L-fucosidase
MLSRRGFTASTLALGACAATPRGSGRAKFEANWDSLIAGYSAPDWFRDAKFGIWAHWSAQCVPEQGDWYARRMYLQGDPCYDHHVRTYGHPSQFGFMEIDNLWRAENWDPEALIQRYKRAGAKYFVALANHHDNFDAYNSRHHAWNSVNVGPKRDIIGEWARVARKHGLKFGVTNHCAKAWHWFQTAYGYDAEGPLAGQRYDASRLTRADGAGKWWDGLDPQQLYAGPEATIMPPDGIRSIAEMSAWFEARGRAIWDASPPGGDQSAYVRQWALRCIDLIDSYRPDLLYFDDVKLPFGQAGLDVAAHYYNASMNWNDGRLEAVLNGKIMPEHLRGALVEDVESGLRPDIFSDPWQTDTCIGNWHYKRSIFEERKYKTAQWVVRALCDNVSKNGNLLLSIPLRGDGTIDSEEEKFLDELTAWMDANGEGIYGTRPWRTFGEGPPQTETGLFNETKQSFTGAHVRFMQKNGDLYAFVLGWPEGGIARIATLGTMNRHAAAAAIERVDLLGAGQIDFARDGDSLTVRLPDARSGEFAHGLRIRGRGLV